MARIAMALVDLRWTGLALGTTLGVETTERTASIVAPIVETAVDPGRRQLSTDTNLEHDAMTEIVMTDDGWAHHRRISIDMCPVRRAAHHPQL